MKKSVFLLVLLPVLMFSQHSIEGIFTPAEKFSFAMLYKSSPTSTEYVNRGVVQSDGSFKIQMDANAPAGIYKIVYALPQEENNFDLIYSGKEDVKLTFSLEEGLVFTASNENELWASYTKSMELINAAISNFYAKESTDEKAFEDIFNTLSDTQKGYDEASKGTIANVFIKANEPYIPTQFEDISTYSKNLKSTYLQRVDFNNELLQSSNFLTDRILAYVFGMSSSTEDDTFNQHIDDIAKAISTTKIEVKSLLLEMLWWRFVELEKPNVANYITNTYLLEIAKQGNNDELLKAIVTYRDNSLGEVAIDFPIKISKGGKITETSLHKLDSADHYLIIFWSSTCFHCLDELPKVKAFIEAHPKNLKVIAIGLEDEDSTWKNTITNYPEFIHVLGLAKWDNTIANEYGIKATPSYFLLDKDKKIIAKPADVETLEVELSKL